MNSDSEDNTVKIRRCRSVTQAEDIRKTETELRKAQPDRPCHKPRDSLFSWSSGFSNFTGFVNWAFLLLSVGGLRLFLENLLKYGVRVDPFQWWIVISGSKENGSGPEHLSLILLLYSFVPILISYTLEKGLSKGIISPRLGNFLQILNIILLIILPMVVIHLKPNGFSLIGASSVCFAYCILFLKLWSYIQTNMWCRIKINENCKIRRRSFSSNKLEFNSNQPVDENVEKKLVKYPSNLTLKDLIYFIFAPTLCYELNFPRTCRIRKRFLLKRIVEVIAGFHVLVALFQQWIIPSVRNSLIPFSNMDVAKALERLLKLAIPNHLVWLIWFYLFFHSFLNLIGELLYFGDRNFYSDWWNANNIETFWRTWNMPVHRWAVRHLYIPLIGLGYNKSLAAISVFFLSAFFHEYLVSVPLRTFKHWAFLGMMWQIPMSYFSKYMERRFGPRCGNIIVWTGLILGMPLCIMMYYHDYVISRFGFSVIGQYSTV